MSVETATYAPATTPLRDWLRAQDVAGIVGTDVYIGGVPGGAGWPAIALSRVGGFTDAPFDRPLFQFDCWSDPPPDGSGAEAETVAMALLTLLESTGRTAISAGVLFLGATGQSPVWLPDPASNQPRYVVTAEVTLKAA